MKLIKGVARYSLEISAVVIGLAAINAVFLSDAFRGPKVDAVNAGQLGDFVGGYVGTALALFSVILLVSTLRKQIREAATREFSEKYFALLQLHRDNVAEIGIGKDFGRKIFVIMIREYRAILEVVDKVSANSATLLNQRDRLIVAYLVLFFGVGPNSSRMLRLALCNFDQNLVDALVDTLSTLSSRESTVQGSKEKGFRYRLFEGHQSRLGHYYRHLYQSVVYVHTQDIPINKYEYVKTIRAQLSTHEQALLLLNSLTPLGARWWDEGLIQEYKLIKNIPRHFFDPEGELDLESLLPPGYFEWQKESRSNRP